MAIEMNVNDADGLSQIRKRVLQLCMQTLHPYPLELSAPHKIDRTLSYGGGVTNCGVFPGWIARHIPAPRCPTFPTSKPNEVLAATAPMTAWDEYAIKLGKSIWTPYQPKSSSRPTLGDIYVLLKDKLRDEKDKGHFAHVGFFIKEIQENGDTFWITADCGQGDNGTSAAYRKRKFDNNEGSLYLTLGGNGLPPDKGLRYLKGWVDIDLLWPRWGRKISTKL